jgi:hypothetical protein
MNRHLEHQPFSGPKPTFINQLGRIALSLFSTAALVALTYCAIAFVVTRHH